jgi:hypothetical protein
MQGVIRGIKDKKLCDLNQGCHTTSACKFGNFLGRKLRKNMKFINVNDL